MQMKKAGVVATGALATVAIMGAPAAAAPSTDASALTKASTSTEGKIGAMRQVGANQLMLARGGGWGNGGWDNGGWDAPWDIDPQSVISAVDGTAITLLPIQGCGATTAVGGAISIPIASPNTVMAGGFGKDDHQDGWGKGGYGKEDKKDVACANGNTKIKDSGEVPLVGLANNTAVSVGVFQGCGATTSALIAASVPVKSPNTVYGDCLSGNIDIDGKDDKWGDDDKWDDDEWEESTRVEGKNLDDVKARMALVRKVAALKNQKNWNRQSRANLVAPQARGGGWDAPWDIDPFGLAGVGKDTAVAALTVQGCAATTAFAGAVTIPITSPNTVVGDCKNANVKIGQGKSKALISALHNTSLNVASIQGCGATTSALLAASIPITSPNTVVGSCYNANTLIG